MKKAGSFTKKRKTFKRVASFDLRDADDKADYEVILNDPNVDILREIRNFSNVSSSMNITLWYKTKTKAKD